MITHHNRNGSPLMITQTVTPPEDAADTAWLIHTARHRAAGKCETEWSGYPHGGCAEYGPPDRGVCPDTATHIAVFTAADPYGPPQTMTVQVCAAHGADMTMVCPGEYDGPAVLHPITPAGGV